MTSESSSNYSRYTRIGSHRTIDSFREHLRGVCAEIPADNEILRGPESPLATELELCGKIASNRWVIQPMEGWDGTEDGNPGELTLRRWRRFGLSGAQLIWGGEAVAVEKGGRANPNQLVIADHTMAGLESLRAALLEAHHERFGSASEPVVGLQLTHSGRFARPEKDSGNQPRLAFRHPLLDARVGVADDSAVLSDTEVGGLIESFISGAVRAGELGFDFVDIKHCHGYLLHEFLGAHTRPGPYGGSFENRTRILREIVAGIRREAPGLHVAVRVSIFDSIPFRRGVDGGAGEPEDYPEGDPYNLGFGVDLANPVEQDLREGHAFLALLEELGIRLVNLSGGSPYYNPHLQRPALYPPSDGYLPPEDPLLSVTRHLLATRALKKEFPSLVIAGSALSYLQEYLPHVAQGLVRDGWMDLVGIGRMVLSYPDLPADTLERGELQRKRICRTFSDCTTAPRGGLVSGCFPLDDAYGSLPDAEALRELKNRASS
jgi:2,4-dienoyl-CoA reductase-like NADH-dependent reductase (Old Yellow Enzyme family)